jgi:hypothetical protein
MSIAEFFEGLGIVHTAEDCPICDSIEIRGEI